MPVHTYCRLCEGACGLVAEGAPEHLTALNADPTDPVSEGFLCEVPARSLAAMRSPERITRPMKRVDGRLVPSTWDEAIQDISGRLKAIRGQSGPQSVALSLGESVQRSSRVLARSLAFGVGMGTPNLFSALVQGLGPRLHLTELMLGHPAPLLSDLGRAHYVVLLGGDQRATDWGPGTLGMAHEKWMNFSRKTKGTKVVVADPRKTELAAAMDQHLAIRPGTEPFFLLGLVSATVRGEWRDRQYVDDFTRHYDKLGPALAEWPLDRCADLCGVPAAALSGVGLKFSRAAMAVLHPGPSSFLNANGGIGAWAWLALHTLTANTLRPGGLYEHKGFVDLHPILAGLPLEGAPRTRVHGYPLLAMQAPETALADEVLTPGEGQVRALLTVSSNPLGDLPGTGRVREALSSLDLLVCLARHEDETAALAHWVLPIPHPWEREDTHLFDSALLPVHGTARAPAVVAPPGEVRLEEDILRDLFQAVRPGMRGSSWGRHLVLMGNLLARADLRAWEDRLVRYVDEGAPEKLATEPHRVHLGDTDRSGWRVTRPDGRIDLLPDAVAEQLARLTPPERDPALPYVLRTSRRLDRAPDRWHRSLAEEPVVSVHPDTGLRDGGQARVVTRYGEATFRVRLDASLRSDTVDVPAGHLTDALGLLGSGTVCPITGAPVRDGLPCAVVQA